MLRLLRILFDYDCAFCHFCLLTAHFNIQCSYFIPPPPLPPQFSHLSQVSLDSTPRVHLAMDPCWVYSIIPSREAILTNVRRDKFRSTYCQCRLYTTQNTSGFQECRSMSKKYQRAVALVTKVRVIYPRQVILNLVEKIWKENSHKDVKQEVMDEK